MKSLDKMAREKFADEINSGDMLFDKTLKVSQVLSEESMTRLQARPVQN